MLTGAEIVLLAVIILVMIAVLFAVGIAGLGVWLVSVFYRKETLP